MVGSRWFATRALHGAENVGQSAEVISKILNQTGQLPGNRRGTVRRSTAVDIGLDVGVNVGQGTSTCSRPANRQKNTRRKWEVRSREPLSAHLLPPSHHPQLPSSVFPSTSENFAVPSASKP